MAKNDLVWEDYFSRLVAYKAVHGNYNVPRRWQEDPGLGTWVDKQRVRKRKFDRGEPSEGMTAERVARLTALGFVWNKKDIQWEENLERLEAYNAVHGDCNVPQGWAEDPGLANWVKKQRMFKRKFDRGEPSEGMTAERAARLTALGFVWDPNKKPKNTIEKKKRKKRKKKDMHSQPMPMAVAMGSDSGDIDIDYNLLPDVPSPIDPDSEDDDMDLGLNLDDDYDDMPSLKGIPLPKSFGGSVDKKRKSKRKKRKSKIKSKIKSKRKSK
jgi:hypothetical protein